MCFHILSADCPLEVEDLNKLAQMHDPNKEDAVDYSVFISCKKFINKVIKNEFRKCSNTIFIHGYMCFDVKDCIAASPS